MVVVLSIVGTLVTDNLTDKYNVALETTTAIFAVALAVTFTAWYVVERTLSIHSIYTPRREAFYWLAILFTFALGTAAGDLIAERYDVGYWKAALLFGGCIALITIAWRYLHLNAILAFWMAYILTRPLGASLGDYLSQPRHDGRLGLGTTATSALFLVAILLVVAYMSVTGRELRRDHPLDAPAQRLALAARRSSQPGRASGPAGDDRRRREAGSRTRRVTAGAAATG